MAGLCGGLLLMLHPPLAGQTPDTVRAPSAWVRPLPAIGSQVEDRSRLAQLLGTESTAGYLLRSPSAQFFRDVASRGGPEWVLLAPEAALTWNSAIPFSMNDGAVWAGRGAATWLRLGAAARYSVLSVVLAPELAYSQNRSFTYPRSEDPAQNAYTLFWYRWPRSVDFPLRFGERSSTRLTWGQSTLALAAGPVAAGVSTESQWWGPGIRDAIVMSNNAPGFPHLFLRTDHPLTSRIGSFEGKWLVGELSESRYFDTLPANDLRSLSGMILTFRPAWDPSLTVGYARTVFAPVGSLGDVPGRFADVATRWHRSNDTTAAKGDYFDQYTSLFARWIFPEDGLEVYGEWARHVFPSSVSDFVDDIGYSQGYTLGTQWARPVGDRGTFRLQGELTYLEQTDSTRAGAPTYYLSATVPQGYTNRGQVIGAAIGPGGSSQWLAADYLAPAWSVGVFGGRIRWDNDSYYTSPRFLHAWPFLAHDVSVLGGVRGSYSMPDFQLTTQLTTARRYNYLFQNRGQSWETADDAVDVRNYTLELGVVALAPSTRPRVPAPVAVTPLPPTPLPDSAQAPLALPTDTLRLPVPSAPQPADTVRIEPPAPSAVPVDTAAVDTLSADTASTVRPDTPGTAKRADTLSARPPVRTHRVERGETLFGIARRYGVPVDLLRSANSLKNDAIYAGQVLRIPSAPGASPPP